VDRVRAAAAYTVAVKTDGTLWAWGANESGQLGDGTDTDETAPVQVGVGHQWFKLSVGSYHTMALPAP
jgi:alpha-tubulin suppressor-like RCC1 family protein